MKKEANLTEVNSIAKAIKNVIPDNCTNDDVLFVCVGTDRSSGDSLGPYIGSMLKKLGYKNVHGDLHDPVHAMNLQEKLDDLPKGKYVIGIDAILGQVSSIGNVIVKKEPLRPGAGVGKDLPQVGECSIGGVVNVGGFMEYFVLQNTKLSTVFDIGNKIVEAITVTLPLEKMKYKPSTVLVTKTEVSKGKKKKKVEIMRVV